jgi:hypothetical protein
MSCIFTALSKGVRVEREKGLADLVSNLDDQEDSIELTNQLNNK